MRKQGIAFSFEWAISIWGDAFLRILNVARGFKKREQTDQVKFGMIMARFAAKNALYASSRGSILFDTDQNLLLVPPLFCLGPPD